MTRHRPSRATRLTDGLALIAKLVAELVGTKGLSLQVLPGGSMVGVIVKMESYVWIKMRDSSHGLMLSKCKSW